MTRCEWLGLWLLFVGFSGLAWSQTGLTSLRGTVSDPSGALLAGTEISLEEPTTGFHVVHKTDQTGAYEFPQIPPGKYTITATKAGFGKQIKTAELLVSQPATINFALSVQAINETVEVSDIAQSSLPCASPIRAKPEAVTIFVVRVTSDWIVVWPRAGPCARA